MAAENSASTLITILHNHFLSLQLNEYLPTPIILKHQIYALSTINELKNKNANTNSDNSNRTALDDVVARGGEPGASAIGASGLRDGDGASSTSTNGCDNGIVNVAWDGEHGAFGAAALSLFTKLDREMQSLLMKNTLLQFVIQTSEAEFILVYKGDYVKSYAKLMNLLYPAISHGDGSSASASSSNHSNNGSSGSVSSVSSGSKDKRDIGEWINDMLLKAYSSNSVSFDNDKLRRCLQLYINTNSRNVKNTNANNLITSNSNKSMPNTGNSSSNCVLGRVSENDETHKKKRLRDLDFPSSPNFNHIKKSNHTGGKNEIECGSSNLNSSSRSSNSVCHSSSTSSGSSSKDNRGSNNDGCTIEIPRVCTLPKNTSTDSITQLLFSYGYIKRETVSKNKLSLVVPNSGVFIKWLKNGRNEIVRLFKRLKYKELLLIALEVKSLRSSPLGMRYHILDLIGYGILRPIWTPNGLMLRLGQRHSTQT